MGLSLRYLFIGFAVSSLQAYGAPRTAREWRRRVPPESSGAPSAGASTAGGPEKAPAAVAAAAGTEAEGGDTASVDTKEAPAAAAAEQQQQQQQQQQVPSAEADSVAAGGAAETASAPKQRAGDRRGPQGGPQQPGPRRRTGPEVWSTEGPVSCSAWVLPAEKLRGPQDNRFLATSPQHQPQQQQQQQQEGVSCSSNSSKHLGIEAADAAGEAHKETAAAAAASATAPVGPPGGPPRKGARRPNAWRVQHQHPIPGYEPQQQQQHQQQPRQEQHVGEGPPPFACAAKETGAPLDPTEATGGTAAQQQQQQPVRADEAQADVAAVPYTEEWAPYWGPPPLGAPGAADLPLAADLQQQQQELAAAYGLPPKLRSPLDASTAATTPAAAAPCPFYAPSWGAPNFLALVSFYRQQQHMTQLLQQNVPRAYEE